MVFLVFALNAIAQAPAAPGGAAAPPSSEELDTLVGPIALYPDDLVAIILPASTNPLQLVQADRYLDKRKADPKLPVDEKWDDAVKSLLNYPDVVKKMSADLDWTSALGEAVVADQGAVLEGIQSFRRRAQAAGNLKSDDKQVVKAEKEIIIIEPADPQVIYVPQYTPSTVVTVGVAPVYGYYPYGYPSYYYPYAPGAALAAGVIWGAAIGAAWTGGRYVSHYGGDANINIDRNTNINVDRGGAAGQRPAAGGGSTAWKSNKQPGQVSNSIGKTAPTARVGDARAGAGGAGYGGGGGRAHRRSPPAVARALRVAGPRVAGRGWSGRDQRVAPRQLWRRQPSRRVGRRCLRGLQLGAADADGQLAWCIEPQLHVQRGCASVQRASRPSGGGAPAAAAAGAAAAVGDGRNPDMDPNASIRRRASTMNKNRLWTFLAPLALALMAAAPLAAAAPQETFATPEAAVDALMAALKADSDASMLAIFGDEHKDMIVQSDRAATSATRAKILAAMQTLRVLKDPAPDRRVLVIGDEAWPVPFPIVRTGDRWRFATEEGKDELINRRIGGNERNAIFVMRAYIDAQRAYAARDRDGDGVLQYAQKLTSTPGKHDGLYWTADAAKGDEASPFGPLIAASAALRRRAQGGRPVPRLSFPDPDAPGHERTGRCVQLRDQRQDDRRLRDGGVPGRLRHQRRDDVHREPQRQGLREGPRQELGRAWREDVGVRPGRGVEGSGALKFAIRW